ncbi:MAG: PQQ-like beta-propeller repeat protein [Alphaproteobacteria bacterium]|nr:PQQ-like beta-propeller repeat protein [Alphaproteobacteria bacterium]
MRKLTAVVAVLILAAGCTKHDPILPGERTAIFEESTTTVVGGVIENLPDVAAGSTNIECPYTQDSSNVIRNGNRKIFTGFPTNNSVKSTQSPVCAGKYVIAGLTTGEVVKVNPANRNVEWIADVFRPSNMTGGASVLDIVAPIVIDGNAVYAGGMGDAFCRINLANGKKKWCTPISVSAPFIITEPAAFVAGTNGILYAVRTSDGAIYWQTPIGKCNKISYENQIITACKAKINAATGETI